MFPGKNDHFFLFLPYFSTCPSQKFGISGIQKPYFLNEQNLGYLLGKFENVIFKSVDLVAV